MKTGIYQNIMIAVMNRYVLPLYNLIVISIIISVVIRLFHLLATPENDIREMIKICNGTAIVLYGYGVALESRGPLMNFLRLYPRHATTLQRGVDYLCHKFGIYILLLGLAEEVLVHFISIPNMILDTEGKELYVFLICFLILNIVVLLLLVFTYNAIRTSRVMSMGRSEAQLQENQ